MGIVNKETFLHSISSKTVFNHSFYMKLYGYQLYDSEFKDKVFEVLQDLNLCEVITNYEEWVEEYKSKQLIVQKKVASRYIEECDRQWKKYLRDQQERQADEWKEKRKELLLRKRNLLLSMQNY